MAIITISRQYGSGGDEIARIVCGKLGYLYFDRSLMIRLASEMGALEHEVVDFSEDSYEAQDFLKRLLNMNETLAEVGLWTEDTSGRHDKVVEVIDEERGIGLLTTAVRTVAKRGNVVIVGRGGQAILRNYPGALHLQIVAPVEYRLMQIQKQLHLLQDEAKKMLDKRDRAAADYLKRFHKLDWMDPTLYHLVINTSKWSLETSTTFILDAVNRL